MCRPYLLLRLTTLSWAKASCCSLPIRLPPFAAATPPRRSAHTPSRSRPSKQRKNSSIFSSSERSLSKLSLALSHTHSSSLSLSLTHSSSLSLSLSHQLSLPRSKVSFATKEGNTKSKGFNISRSFSPLFKPESTKKFLHLVWRTGFFCTLVHYGDRGPEWVSAKEYFNCVAFERERGEREREEKRQGVGCLEDCLQEWERSDRGERREREAPSRKEFFSFSYVSFKVEILRGK